MQTSTKTLIVALNVFLLLSFSPIEARRTIEARAAVESLSSEALNIERAVRDLEQALAEDQAADAAGGQAALFRSWRGSGHLAERGHASGWWCSSQRRSFESRAATLQEQVEAMKTLPADTKPGFVDTAHVVLEARKLAKTLEGAQKWGCTWAKDGTMSKAPFQQILSAAMEGNRCFAKGAAVLSAARNSTEVEQGKALSDALALMFSSEQDTCEPMQVDPDAAEPAVDPDAEDRKAEAAAEQLAKSIGEPGAATSPSLLEQGSMSLAELVESSWRSEIVIGIDFFIYALLGFIAIVVITLACTVALTVLVLLVGIIFCMLRTAMMKLLSYFKTTSKTSFKGCAYVLWRQTVGYGINENNNDQYTLLKKGGGVKLIQATCAVPTIATVIAATPFFGR